MPASKGLKPPYTDTELAGILQNQLATAGQFAEDFLVENRREAWRYYLNRRGRDGEDVSSDTARTGYERGGTSQAVSEDVADMVEALMATLMSVFGSDIPVEFEPVAEGDEEQASAESEAVSNVLMDKNQGWLVLATALKDALLFRNGTIKCFIEERTRSERRKLKDISDEELAMFVAAVPQGIDLKITSRNGKDVNITLSETIRKPKVVAIEQAMFILDPNHDDVDIQDINFCAERKFPTRSELLDEGFNKAKVNKLGAFTHDNDIDASAKKIEGVSGHMDRATFDADLIETFEVYMRLDMTGDGRSNLMRFIFADKVVLDKAEVDFIPYATGTGWLVPHRYSGISVFDKLQQVTDIKTRTLQTYLNNLTTNNTARTVVDENTMNLDDMLAGRPNAVIRNDGPPAQAVLPFPTNDTGPSSQALLNYMDEVRDQRAGAALSMQQSQEQLAKSNISAASADRQMSPGELQAGMIARTLAETLIRSTFLLLHETLRTQFPEQIMLRRQGKWVGESPQQWRPRSEVNVIVGLSPAERNRKAGSLIMTLQQQLQMMEQGNGIIVDLNGVHRAILDWSKMMDLPDAHKYWLDPESEGSQQAAQQQAQQQQEQFQTQMQALSAEAQAQAMNAQLDHIQSQQELQFKYFDALLSADLEEAKIIEGAIANAEAAQSARTASTNGTGGSGPVGESGG